MGTMSEAFFQIFILVCAGAVTGFVGWMAVNVSKSSGKIYSLEKDVKAMAENIEKLRGTELDVARLTVQVNGIERRVTDLEHPRG